MWRSVNQDSKARNRGDIMIQRNLKIFGKKRSVQAMTLSELMVAVLLFAALTGAALFILTAGFESWRANSLKTQQQDELRKSMDWIMGDLVQSGASVVSIPANGTWYTTISFKKATGVTNGSINWSAVNTQYALAGTNPVLLQRTTGASTRIIAQNIETLQFRRQAATPNVVEVRLTAKNSNLLNKWQGVQKTVTFAVKMRNS